MIAWNLACVRIDEDNSFKIADPKSQTKSKWMGALDKDRLNKNILVKFATKHGVWNLC